MADIAEDVTLLQLSASHVTPYAYGRPELDQEACALVKTLSDEALAHLCTGGFPEPELVRKGKFVPGAVGVSTWVLEAQGIPSLNMADGPAGLHISGQYGIDALGIYPLVSAETKEVKRMLPEPILSYMLKRYPEAANDSRGGEIFDQYCTAIPIETALAQSWDPSIGEACGTLVAEEMQRFGVQVWLSPALNIHRNPLCGRNFEYFSEDPLISAKMAVGVVQGAQKHPHCGCTLKHFVCNEQEYNRLFNNSMVSERALRDIYLRAFEIVIKEAKPKAVMSSYNLLNGEHTAHRRDLLETVLRDEWGFEGIVMSDWVGGQESGAGQKYHIACANGAVAAGNDVMMPGDRVHYDHIINALDNPDSDYPLTRADLEKCGARMIAYVKSLT